MKRKTVIRVAILAVVLGLTALTGIARGSATPQPSPMRVISPVTAGVWRSGGPYDDQMQSLRVNGVAASPAYAADSTLFAASDVGVHRSADQGRHWQVMLPRPQEAPDGKFAHVRLSPGYATDHTVYVAYYDPQTTRSALHRSTDGGENWTQVVGFNAPITVLTLSPGFPVDDTIFAVVGSGHTLLKSQDGGSTWSEYPFASSNGYFASRLVASPAYVSDRTLFATGFGNVQRSTDGGVTWQLLTGYSPTYGLALSPAYAADRTVWATYRFIESPGDGTPESGVIRSADRGNSWLLASVGLPGFYEPFPRALAVSPAYATDRSLFSALGGQLTAGDEHSLFRSFNGGDSWVDLGPAPHNPDVYELAVTHTESEGLVVHMATVEGVWHYGGLCEERLVNGGFETEAAWTLPVTVHPAGYSTQVVHGGRRSLRAGIVTGGNVYSYSSAYQTVTIPAGVESAGLTFWWYPISAEGSLVGGPEVLPNRVVQAVANGELPAGTTADDRQYVLLLDEKGNVLRRLMWTRSNAQAWQSGTFDLSAYAGRTVRLHFGVLNDGADGATAMYVDDVSLAICWPGAPEPTPTPTVTVTPTVTPSVTPGPLDEEVFLSLILRAGVTPTPTPTPTP